MEIRTEEEVRKHKKGQNVASLAILVLGTIAAWLIFGPKGQDDADLSALEENAPSALVSTLTVSADGSRTAKLEKTVTFSALGARADAVSEFSGRVSSVNFEAGDVVTKGQILAVFDQTKLKNAPKAALESAERSLRIAEENFSDTEDLVKKNKDLAERSIEIAKLQKEQAEKNGTDEDVDIAKKNVDVAKDQKDQVSRSGEIQVNGARLQAEQTRAVRDQARVAYENTFIKSPIAGTVVSKNVNQGDFLNDGQIAAGIVGAGKLDAVLYLNRDEIERIKEGDAVEIKIDGKSYAARVDSFSLIANGGNSRFEVKISSEEQLSRESNRTGQAIFNVYLDADAAGGFFIPLDAVNIGQSKKEVFVVSEGKARAREVELGKIIGTQVEVLSGLDAGDQLIVNNGRNLTDGQSVRAE